MLQFNELCFDIKNPLFNDECALSVLKKISFSENDLETLNKCMVQLVQYESKIDNDFNTFNKRKIYSIPDLFINGVPYRGTWYSKYIFRSICNGFLDDAKILFKQMKQAKHKENEKFRLLNNNNAINQYEQVSDDRAQTAQYSLAG